MMHLNFVIASLTPGTFFAAENKTQLVTMDEYHMSDVFIITPKYLQSNASLAFRWKLWSVQYACSWPFSKKKPTKHSHVASSVSNANSILHHHNSFTLEFCKTSAKILFSSSAAFEHLKIQASRLHFPVITDMMSSNCGICFIVGPSPVIIFPW